MTTVTLERLATGDIAPAKAWTMIRPLLDDEGETSATRVYTALRSWTWKALDRRRRDSMLRQWIDVLNRAEAYLADRFALLAAKIEALVELLHESLTVGEVMRASDPMRRKHTREIVLALRDEETGWTARSALMERLQIKSANMTRIMNILADARIVEVEETGREVAYRLSTEGVVVAQHLDRHVSIHPVMSHFRKMMSVRELKWSDMDMPPLDISSMVMSDTYSGKLVIDSSPMVFLGGHDEDTDRRSFDHGIMPRVSVDPRYEQHFGRILQADY